MDSVWIKNDMTTEIDEFNRISSRAKIAIVVLVVLWTAVVSLIDRSHNQPIALTSLLAIGPVVSSLALSTFLTGSSALLSTLLTLPLGAGDYRFVSMQHLIDTSVVLVVGALSVYISYLRQKSAELLVLSEQRATRDSLTGILNRRAVFAFGNHLAALRSDDRPALSILMIDVDHLKEINDDNGHQCGDQVLTEVSQILSTALRSGDVVGRYGGDEFLALLIGGEPSETDAVCERVLSEMRNSKFSSSQGELHVSVSIGISQLSPSENDLGDVLARADHALYESKRRGRATSTRA